MVRRTKTEEDRDINSHIGGRLAVFRRERGWSLQVLADRLQISNTHLNSLETGKYAFSAALLARIAAVFGEPVTAFMGAGPPVPGPEEQWRRLYEALPSRDRVVMLDLAQRLADWWDTSRQHHEAQHTSKACLVSLEGIDGVSLHRVGEAVVRKLRPRMRVEECRYDCVFRPS